jgi:F-type H+-transporting ATPase subunit b
LEALGINLGYLLVQIINFLVLLVILRAWVYQPLLDMLANRRERIAQGLEDARVAEEARDNAEEEAQAILNEANTEANEIIRNASERAESAASDIKSEAEKEAAKILEIAKSEAQQERDRILADLRGQVATLALAAAQRLIRETLDERRQRALLNEFFSGVKEGEIVVLEDEVISGTHAEITSALPLTQEEQETIKRDVLSKVGEQASITFRVDPSILGGLIIRVGDKVVDGSVAGKLESLRQRMV